MVRREIKSFELVTEAGRFACQTPFTVRSVLSEAGTEMPSDSSSVSFDSEIFADDAALGVKNFYIRIKGIHTPCMVYIGDKMIGECDGKTPVYNFDAKGYVEKGANTLSIRPTTEGASLLSAGISSPVELIRFGSAIIDRLSLTQTHGDDGVSLGIKIDMIGDSSSVRAVATLVASSGQIYYAGLTKGKGSILVRDPLYWWPRGIGVQNLYRLSVNLYGETDIEDSLEMRVGLRTVRADGHNIVIGDTRVLPMGAVYLSGGEANPASLDKKTEAFVTSAAMSGFNCLVVSAESERPSEKFYELCDIHGIMVIEELSELYEGSLDALRRNAHHPCLCLVDYIAPGDDGDLNIIKRALPDADATLRGEHHRYVSAPSLPSMKTIRAAIPENERSLFSHSVEAIAEDGAIQKMLLSVSDRYPYPKDLSTFAYASALAASNIVGEEIKLCRLSEGKLGRGVFNRLCDSDLAISPSSIDHRFRWKPLQYYAQRHFSPAKVYAENEGGSVKFSVSNHRRILLSGVIEYRLSDSENNTVHKGDVPVELSQMSAGEIASVDLSSLIAGHEREYYLDYSLKEGTTLLSRGVLLFVPEKHFEFKKPKLKTVITGEGRRFSLTVSSDVFVKDLELDFDGVDVVLYNNYVDLTSDAPAKIDFTVTASAQTTYHLKDVMQLRSIFDLK